MPKLDGSSHVVLVVRDLERSAKWYCDVFGFQVIRDHVEAAGFEFISLLRPDSFAFLGLAKLQQGESPPFEDAGIGLQHYGYHVPDSNELEVWIEHLDTLGIEHSKIESEGFGSVVRFQDPDGIPLEVFCVEKNFFIQRLRERHRENRQRRTP